MAWLTEEPPRVQHGAGESDSERDEQREADATGRGQRGRDHALLPLQITARLR